MPANRMDVLKDMVEQNPRDSFSRYGLAMEYANSGQFESAVAQFQALVGFNPEYAAAYFHGGQALEKLGGKGGGTRDFARGKLGNGSQVESVLTFAREKLSGV